MSPEWEADLAAGRAALDALLRRAAERQDRDDAAAEAETLDTNEGDR